MSWRLTPKITVLKQCVKKKKINELVINCERYNCNYEQQALFIVTYYVQNITEYLQHITFGFTTSRPADTQALILEEWDNLQTKEIYLSVHTVQTINVVMRSTIWYVFKDFDVLLTKHLSITLVNDQFDAQLLYFIIPPDDEHDVARNV